MTEADLYVGGVVRRLKEFWHHGLGSGAGLRGNRQPALYSLRMIWEE
jgi:hypothetical protein